ncbi:MAG: hypothetical protein KQI81_14150, partial [Deltaproteobacteria bacterium]|nr:hypothetical protein [Deltaproteobacteria bacterium]
PVTLTFSSAVSDQIETNPHHLLIGAGISLNGCQLLESLVRHQLIMHRPINFLAAAYDGVIVEHPAWLPVEVRTTPLAMEHHRDDIFKYLFGKPKDLEHETS